MNGKNVLIILLFAYCLIFCLTGCMSYSTLQTAETVPAGKIRLGAGCVTTLDFSSGLPELGGRIGVAKNLDLGVKYSLPYTLVIDTKYQFLRNRINASFDFGWSHCSEEGITLNGFYPMILAGQKNWYIGIKGNYFTTNGEFDLFDEEITFNESAYFGTSIITGGMIGNDYIKFLIELNTYLGKDYKPTYIPGIGLYLEF